MSDRDKHRLTVGSRAALIVGLLFVSFELFLVNRTIQKYNISASS